MKSEKNIQADPRIEFFDNLAENWDNEEPSSEQMAEGLNMHSSLLNLQSGDNLLEVGCGTGKTTAWLVQQIAPGSVTAVDFSPAMIAQANQKTINADFLCMDVCSDSLGAERFDVILCFHCFPHFRDQSSALKNLTQSLKESGRLIVMHLAGSEHINGFHANLDGPVNGDMLPTGNDWIPLLNQAGLERIKLIDQENLFFMEAIKSA